MKLFCSFAANNNKWIMNMKYEPVKYNSREEAIAALRRMNQRKRELEKRVQEEFLKARQEADNCYANL